MENTNQLETLVKSSGLSIEKTNEISEGLSVFFAKASEWAKKVDSIQVTDPSQTGEMKIARESRLTLRGYRLEAEKIIKGKREILKEKMSDDILFDKLLLNASKMIKATFENLETKLEEKEKFAERWEAENKAKLRNERLIRLALYCDDASIYPVESMTAENFESLVLDMQVRQKQRQQDERNKARQEALIKAGFRWNPLKDVFEFESVSVTPEEIKMFSDTEFARRVLEAENIIREIREMKQKEIDAKEKENAELRRQLADAKKPEQTMLEKPFEEIAKMTEKQRLIAWVEEMKIAPSPVPNAVAMDIFKKYHAFKKWAVEQINSNINE